MKNNIEKYFHQEHKDELEKQSVNLGKKEIDWIIGDIQDANNGGGKFKITNMKFNPVNKTINLGMKDDSTGETIERDLIL